MKTVATLVLVSLLICTSCQEEIKTPQATEISGTITNHTDRDLNIRDFFGKSEWKESLNISESRFKKTYDLEKPVIKMLQYDLFRKDIYLEPNKSLEIYFDANNPEESFIYKGDLAMANVILDSVSSTLNGIDYRYVYDLELDAAVNYLDSLKSASKSVFQRLKKANKSSSDFNDYVNALIDYNIAGLKIRLGERKETQPENYYAFLDELTLTNPDLLDIPDYRMFLYMYLTRKSNFSLKQLDSIQRNSPDAEFNAMNEAISQLENDDIRAYSLYNAMVLKLRESNIEDFKKHYEYFKMHGTDPYVSQLEMAIEEKKMIAAGKTAPAFTLEDLNGEEKSLADFKGQYVLLDFWNSRCGVCRRELPHYLKLQSEFENENIAFVSISNDPDPSDWKTYASEKKNVGTSLWTDKFFDSEILKAYQVKGTPTYVLIDTEGKIVDPMVPNPSSPKMKELLNRVLEIQ